MDKKKIASELVKLAKELIGYLPEYSVSSSDRKWLLNQFKGDLRMPKYSRLLPRTARLLINTEGTSNKFHFFMMYVYPLVDERGKPVLDERGEYEDPTYVAGNVYGRIGATARAHEIAEGTNIASVKSKMDAKIRVKERKGYRLYEGKF